MSQRKASGSSGRDHYDEIYRSELALEAQWLAHGCVDKVDSIELLLNSKGIRPRKIIELGCGTGAVIRECQRRRLASEFAAVDYSQDAIEYVRQHVPGVQTLRADILSPSFHIAEQYDVVVLTHVLEHLENPAELLRALLEKVSFQYAVVEVPLEDLPASRLKNLLRDRRKNAAGHVQFFTAPGIRNLLSSCGFEVLAERRYAPVLPAEMIDLLRRKDGGSAARAAIRLLTGHFGPKLMKRLWARLYYSNIAILCRPCSK
jgi:SAM-dependent methyltransferase